MTTVLFDLDGTLTSGDGLGTRCFFDAIEETFDLPSVDRDLHGYDACTDAGIVARLLADVRGRPAGEQELAKVRDRYLARLGAELERRPRAYRALPGAASMLRALPERLSVAVGLATANWEGAARMKLDSAELGGPPLVGGFAEDGLERAAVVRASLERVPGARLPACYIGDRPCDVDAARSLGMGFVGVGSGSNEAALRAAGAPSVIADYRDLDAFLDIVRAAPSPLSVASGGGAADGASRGL